MALAFNIRFVLQLNAREAMHVLELRSGPQGHPAYRRIAQEMHRLIAEEAGHRAIASRDVFRGPLRERPRPPRGRATIRGRGATARARACDGGVLFSS